MANEKPVIETTSSDNCYAIKDECTDTILYMRITNGLVSFGSEPCDISNPDPSPAA